MVNCCAVGCQSRSGRNSKGCKVGFYRFPLASDPRFDVWCTAVRRRAANGKLWKPIQRLNAFLCSKHFTPDQFVPWFDGQSHQRLKVIAVPTIFDYVQVNQKKLVKKKVLDQLENNVNLPLLKQSSDGKVNVSRISAVDKNNIYHDHHYELSQADIRKRIRELEDNSAELHRRLKETRNESLRRKRKISNLLQKLQRSKDELKINQEELKLHKNVDLSVFQRKDQMYSDKLKAFSMKLMACSPKAYDLIREEFRAMGLTFPSIRTICNWKSQLSDRCQIMDQIGVEAFDAIDVNDFSLCDSVDCVESRSPVEDNSVEVVFLNSQSVDSIFNMDGNDDCSDVCVFDLGIDTVWNSIKDFD